MLTPRLQPGCTGSWRLPPRGSPTLPSSSARRLPVPSQHKTTNANLHRPAQHERRDDHQPAGSHRPPSLTDFTHRPHRQGQQPGSPKRHTRQTRAVVLPACGKHQPSQRQPQNGNQRQRMPGQPLHEPMCTKHPHPARGNHGHGVKHARLTSLAGFLIPFLFISLPIPFPFVQRSSPSG